MSRHVAAAAVDAGQIDRFGPWVATSGRRSVRLAAFHEGAEELVIGRRAGRSTYVERREQRLRVDLLAHDARHHAVAIVGDGGQRLVEFVRDAWDAI